jgi:hypothetical protein
VLAAAIAAGPALHAARLFVVVAGSQEPKRPWMQVLDAEARIFMFQ